MKKQNGITLIALVISIIVMLILAGVSINAVVGDNGVLNRAQEATLSQKYASYLEELEMSLTSKSMGDIKFNRGNVNAFGENVKEYISNLESSDIGKVSIVGGKMYLSNADSSIADKFGIAVENNIENLEDIAIENIIQNLDNEKIGIQLRDKAGSATDWKIVTEINKESGNVNKIYGTGYYYIEAGTNVGELGNVKNGYLINYDNLNKISITASSEYSYTYLDISSTLGVTDNLVFNMDAQTIEKDVNGQYNWGEGVILKSTTLDDDLIVAENYIDKQQFIFDGTNYIEIHNDTGFDFSKGITLEFFGNIKGNTAGEVDGTTSFAPLLGIYKKGTNPATGSLCMRSFIRRKKVLLYNLGGMGNTSWDNGWSESTSVPWNIQLDLSSESIFNKDTYFSIVISPEKYEGNEKYITQTVYYNGVKFAQSYLDVNYWKDFLTNELGTVYFARGNISNNLNKMNLIGNVYTVRIYKDALTEEEIGLNYNATLSYHKMFEGD